MKKTILLIIGLILCAAASSYAYDDGDFQIWNTEVEEFHINNEATIAFEENFRWGNNASEFYYQSYGIEFSYDLEKWLNISGGYQHIYQLKKEVFKLENQPSLTANLRWEVNGLKFSDRHRIEYRHFNYQDDSWRYRNKLTVRLPWIFTRLEIQPYIADEIFIGFSTTNELNQNRFASGVSMNLTKTLSADMYYLLQSTKSAGTWTDANVFGTKLKITF